MQSSGATAEALNEKVLITGAQGFIGRHLCRHLMTETEFAVVGAVREGSVHDGHSEHLYPVGDLVDKPNLQNVLQGCTQIVHTAGLAHNKSHDDELIWRTNYDATLHLAREAEKSGVKKFIFLSSVAVYGGGQSSDVLNEDTRVKPSSAYGKSKLAAEEALRELSKRSQMEIIVIRPALVYAADAPANMRSLIRLAASGLPLPFGSANNKRHLLAVENLCDFIALLIKLQTATQKGGAVYTLADDEGVSLNQIVTQLRKGMKLSPRLFSMSPPVMASLLRVIGKSEVYSQLFGSLQISNNRAKETLGWIPVTDIHQGLERAGEEFIRTTQSEDSA